MTSPRSPAASLAARDRNARWCAEHRACTNRQPWLAGAPPFAPHLPGASMSISVQPAPKWPIEMRNTRGLHGAMTAILDIGHMPRFPLFALRPWKSGWAVHWWHPSGVALAGKTVHGTLYDRPTVFTFGPAFRLRAPTVRRRGHQRVRLDVITPVIFRTQGGARECVRPTGDAFLGTLGGEWLTRFGLAWMRERDLIRVETVDVRTQPVRVHMGDKYGTVAGWEGSVDLDVNAPARWLLEVGARTGLGSRTAFGFGRIALTELP